MSNLISLKTDKKIVFVGDTHGDLDATKKVIYKFLKPGYIIVFLGDYVDRGKYSRENVDFLLKIKKENPKQVYLLLGNHDSVESCALYASDFWDDLTSKEKKFYSNIFSKFPLVFTCKNIIACHGVLPDFKDIREVNEISTCDESWMRLLWGDFEDKKGESLDGFAGRPTFGKDYFKRVMKNFGKDVLIRGHQLLAKGYMFNRHCLTLLSSDLYGKKLIAIADMSKKIKSAKDLKVFDLDKIR